MKPDEKYNNLIKFLKRNDLVPAHYNKFNNNLLSTLEIMQLETIIANKAILSYFYAKDVMRGKWVPGEKIMATDSYIATMYALYVLNARFELGEAAIVMSIEHTYLYITCIIGEDGNGEKEVLPPIGGCCIVH